MEKFDILNSLISILLGALIKFFVPGYFFDTEFYRKRRQKKDDQRIKKYLNEIRNDIILGRFQVRNISLLPLFHGLLENEVVCSMSLDAANIDSAFQELEYTYLPGRIKQLIGNNLTVDLNDTYSLRNLSVTRPQDKSDIGHDRRNSIVLTFEPSNFRYNLMINEALDKKLISNKDGNPVSLREYLNLKSFRWDNLSKTPFHMWFCTVVNVITSDNYLVISLRSNFQLIGNEIPENTIVKASASVAEGMLRPVDSDTNPNQFVDSPSPFKTAKRGLEKELGMRSEDNYTTKDLQLISICFDSQRYQPLAVFYVEVKSTFEEILQCWSFAPDKHENQSIINIRMTPNEIAKLLMGRLLFEGKPISLFSNHQQMSVLLASCKKFGVERMRKALSSQL